MSDLLVVGVCKLNDDDDDDDDDDDEMMINT